MTQSSQFKLVTIIGFNYLHPIAALIEKLLELPRSAPNEFQAPPIENGYSASIVTLTAFMVESGIRRTQYVMDVMACRNVLAFLNRHLPDCAIIAEITELLVARDVIAHNHVWEADVEWEPGGLLQLRHAEKLAGGDRKFLEAIDVASRTTKRLRLNLFPTRVDRADVATALAIAKSFFDFLEREDRRYFYVSPQPVEFQGEIRDLAHIVRATQEAFRPA